jgi:hypothetical protein
MLLNDVHSRLNPSHAKAIFKPQTLGELVDVIRQAAQRGEKVCAFGGRHAMGGQQFIEGGVQIDTTALTRVISSDCERGLIEVEAGIMWPALIEATHTMPHPDGATWAIRQKQTGVDDVTLGGSVSAAAHGRGLLLAPMSDDMPQPSRLSVRTPILESSSQRSGVTMRVICFRAIGTRSIARFSLNSIHQTRTLYDHRRHHQ